MRIKGLTRMFRGLRANGVRCLAPLCPKRRPPRPQQPVVTGFRRGGLHFGPHCRQSGGIALHEAPTRRRHACRGLHVVQNPHRHRHGGRRRDSRAWPDNEPTRRATSAAKTPLVWRAPEGPEGTGGLRGAAPNEVRTPSLAGGRALRRPQHPWGHKQTSDNQRHTATRSVL